MYVAPGNASCVCMEGWTGNGRVCVELNNCQLEGRGGCSPNADCNHIGPGQVGSRRSMTDNKPRRSLIVSQTANEMMSFSFCYFPVWDARL